jgi:hypothetical protein
MRFQLATLALVSIHLHVSRILWRSGLAEFKRIIRQERGHPVPPSNSTGNISTRAAPHANLFTCIGRWARRGTGNISTGTSLDLLVKSPPPPPLSGVGVRSPAN